MTVIEFMGRDPDAFVEPWTPQVGDRVRIRLTGECQLLPQHGAWALERLPEGLGHMAEENGRTGLVVQSDLGSADHEFFASQGHPYLVAYDEGFPIGSFNCVMDWYAARELELLEEP